MKYLISSVHSACKDSKKGVLLCHSILHITDHTTHHINTHIFYRISSRITYIAHHIHHITKTCSYGTQVNPEIVYLRVCNMIWGVKWSLFPEKRCFFLGLLRYHKNRSNQIPTTLYNALLIVLLNSSSHFSSHYTPHDMCRLITHHITHHNLIILFTSLFATALQWGILRYCGQWGGGSGSHCVLCFEQQEWVCCGHCSRPSSALERY